MAKGKKDSMESPLYQSGRMNGPAEGPKGPVSPKDPMGYTNLGDHLKAPGGSPGDRGKDVSP